MDRQSWLRFRVVNGIGASEVNIILGLNDYKSSLELFYEKLGQKVDTTEGIFAFMGKEKEDFIGNLYQYWENDEETMIKNYREGKIIRRVKKVNSYIQNPLYPHLFVSLDREINKYDSRGNGALEIKTVSGWVLKKWENDLPPAYVVQIQTQLLVCGYTWGEACILKDGVHMDVLPFEQHKGIQKTIIETTKSFWDKVVRARVVLTRQHEAKRTFNYKLAEECEAEIHSLEPSPDNSQAYSDFLKKKWKISDPGERTGTDEQFRIAVDHSKVQSQLKKLENKKRLFENQLKNFMRDGADMLTFGDNGYVSWKNDVAGSRRFLNKIK